MRSSTGIRDLFWGLGLLLWVAGLLRWPQEVIAAGQQGLTLCASTLLPSLFPFFVLSSLLVSLNLTRYPGRWLEHAMKPLFGIRGSGASALLLGMVGGYPVGAKTVAELYRSGQCSKAEAQRLLLFCNNAGPAFFLGVVGGGILKSVKLGLLLWLCHMASALLLGILMQRLFPLRETAVRSPATFSAPNNPSSAQLFVDAVKTSFFSVLNICAFVVLFGILLSLCRAAGLFDLLTGACTTVRGVDTVQALVSGWIELSNGIAALPIRPLELTLPLASFLLGWGGICVHCQTLSVLSGSGLSALPYLCAKLVHGLLSAALCSLLFALLPHAVTAMARDVVSESPLFSLTPGLLLCLSLCLAAVLLLPIEKFKAGNRRKDRI